MPTLPLICPTVDRPAISFDDKELARRIKRRDAIAMGEMYERYSGLVRVGFTAHSGCWYGGRSSVGDFLAHLEANPHL